MTETKAPRGSKPLHQSGVAALEFALIATLMILILLGCLVYWRVLQAQQSVTRATGDGARIVQNLIYGTLSGYDLSQQSDIGNITAAATTVVRQSLQGSGIPGNPQQDTTVTLISSNYEVRLNVVYRLPPLFSDSDGQPQTDNFSSWALTEPTSLEATAVVSFE